MSSFSVKKQFGESIERIWNNDAFNQISIKERGYAVQDEIIQKSLLFVGINPSYNKIPERIFYNQDHGNLHRYFKKFTDIYDEVKTDWSHIDLLFVRETNQSIVKSIAEDELGNLFINEQLKISKKIIEYAQPKIIIVNNTYARQLLREKKEIDLSFKFDEELGTERIISHDCLNSTPVFFTSMLTGQRALDLGSFKRLIWHIKYVMKKID